MVCHRCGNARAESSAVRCEECDVWFVSADAHTKYPRDQLLGEAIAGKYPLVDILGEGGFGTVYRARQLADGKSLRDVAVKVVKRSGAVGDEEATGRFRREAQAIARLNHPNIVQLYDFGVEDDGTFYMVL